MQNIQTYKRLRSEYSKKNVNYDTVMKEYERLTYLYDPTADKLLYNRYLMDITIGSSSNNYNPDTAIEPLFSSITYKNMASLNSAGVMNFFNGIHDFYSGYNRCLKSNHVNPNPASRLKGEYIIPPIKIPMQTGLSFDRVVMGICKSYNSAYGFIDSPDFPYSSTSNYGSWPASIAFTNNATTSSVQRDFGIFFLKNSSENFGTISLYVQLNSTYVATKSIVVTGLNTTTPWWYSFAKDAYNYWLIYSTSGSTVITDISQLKFVKICSVTELDAWPYDSDLDSYAHGLSYLVMQEFNSNYTSSTYGQNYNNVQLDWSGTLPWN